MRVLERMDEEQISKQQYLDEDTGVSSHSPLGALIAGGRSTRYGATKALEAIQGRRLVDGVAAALAEATDEVVLIANEAALRDQVDFPTRADGVPGLGPLGGVLTALHWAARLKRPGILAVACDLPFPSAPLLRRIAEMAASGGADAVVPENPGNRRGIEPLFAFYSRSCIEPIESSLARRDHRMVGFLEQVRVEHLPLDEVRRYGDPERLFFNVNTRADLELARRMTLLPAAEARPGKP